MPSRAVGAAQAVTSTMVSPARTITEPSACFASRPVSIDSDLFWPKVMLRVCIVLSLILAMPVLRPVLLPDPEPADQLGVPIGVLALQVVQQTPPLADQLEEPASRVMILRMSLEVFREVVDALAEQRNLNFGRAGV